MSRRGDILTLGETAIAPTGHVCAFFNSADEEFGVLIPFIMDGANHGDKLWYIVDPARQAEIIQRLRREGVDTIALQESGQLEFYPWEKAHLRRGSFNKEAMLSLLDETLTSHEEQGYPLTRIWSNQEWALNDVPGVTEIVEYESRCNYVAERHPGLTVCVYDLSQFGATLVMDILRTHPLAIIAGILHENPFYTPPDQFLRELSRRTNEALP
jgi:hypothetical protein